MSPTYAALPHSLGNFSLTKHAVERMVTRSISHAAVEAALEFGRCSEIRDAEIFTIGRQEVARYRCGGVDLSALEGTQVVATPSGAIITVYRVHNFKNLRTPRRGSLRR